MDISVDSPCVTEYDYPMFNFIKSILPNKKGVSASTLDPKTILLIRKSYKNRIKEIESLRKYDRGEKQIDARDIDTIVRAL